MIDRHKESVGFKSQIDALADRLHDRGVVITVVEFSAEAFGSWHIIGGTKEKQIDFTYEGKESYMRYRDAAIAPKDHADFEHRSFKRWEGEDPIAFMEQVLSELAESNKNSP